MKNEKEKFLRASDVAELFSVSVSTVWAWAKIGKLPKPIKLSYRCTVWRLSDVLAIPELA